jgi:hypothetical protein
MTHENIPWPITANWLLGLTGALGMTYLGLEVTARCRKLFGKQPPVSEEIARLDGELRRSVSQATQDCERRHDALRGEMDERFRELTIERARSLANLYEKINRVAEDVAFIRGKLSTD